MGYGHGANLVGRGTLFLIVQGKKVVISQSDIVSPKAKGIAHYADLINQ
jgi:hypothetical protein